MGGELATELVALLARRNGVTVASKGSENTDFFFYLYFFGFFIERNRVLVAAMCINARAIRYITLQRRRDGTIDPPAK